MRPMIGMKFWSPGQRGTTCWWRWAAMPAPAMWPWFMPRLKPPAPDTWRIVRIASRVSSAISTTSSSVTSV